jgi:hypothetical protein
MMISNAELDRLIAELGRHPLAEGELREVKEAVFVSLNQSQPEGIEYAFCLSSGGRMHFFFQEGGLTEARDETASAMWDGACDSDARALREGGTTEGRSVRNGATSPA